MKFFGARVFESPDVVMPGPRRKHKKKRWDRRGVYHARIQKKWLKRYGTAMIPGILMTSAGYHIHPEIMAELRAELTDALEKQLRSAWTVLLDA